MGRPESRSTFTTEQRVILVEQDVDTLFESIEQISDRVGRVLWTLGGVLISVATAAILLAVNLVVGASK